MANLRPNLWGEMPFNNNFDSFNTIQYDRDMERLSREMMINPPSMSSTFSGTQTNSSRNGITDALSYSLLASNSYAKSELPKTVDEVVLIEHNEVDDEGDIVFTKVIGVCRSHPEANEFLLKLKSRMSPNASMVSTTSGLTYDNPLGGKIVLAKVIVRIGVPF